MSDSGRKNKRYAKAYNPYEIQRALKKEQRDSRKEELKEKVDNSVKKLNSGIINVRIQIKISFWNWLFKTARYLSSQDIKTPHEVLISSSPNPYGSGISADAGGAASIVAKVFQLLLMPIQKGLQYWIWKMQPDPTRPERPNVSQDSENEEDKKKWHIYAKSLNDYQQQLREKELLKPRFTRKDAGYLALDITMLALTIATFAVAAPYASAAIALSAACVSFAVAAYHVTKYFYETNKIKKDKSAIDKFLETFDDKSDQPLSKSECDFLKKHGYKIKETYKPDRATAKEYLESRSTSLGEQAETNKKNIYTKFRQTFGLGLTMMMVVGAGLMLGGVALGPYGAPVIAAGLALSITAGVIAFGMFIVNAIKNKRDHTKARTSTLPLERENKNDNDNEPGLKQDNTPLNSAIKLSQTAEHKADTNTEPEDELIKDLQQINDSLQDIIAQLSSLNAKLTTPQQAPKSGHAKNMATFYAKPGEAKADKEKEEAILHAHPRRE